jgi:hypothetical protein
MTKHAEDVLSRYHACIAERNLQEPDSRHYEKLSKIAKLILDELTQKPGARHIMFLRGTDYDYRIE